MGDVFLGGGFNTLLGSDSPLFGYESGRTEQESRTRADPLTMRSNRMRSGQIQDILGATGGLAQLYGPESDRFFQLNPQAQQALTRATQQSQMPGLTPEQWYSQSVASLDPSSYTQAANKMLTDILQPQLQSQFATMGMGRSGAMGEALGKAGTQLTLPIAQQQLQNLFALNQKRPEVDIGLRQAEIARQYAGFQAADIPRQLEQANWQRKAQGLGSAFNLIPYVAGQDSQAVSRDFGNIVMDLVGMVLGSQVGRAALGAMTGMPTLPTTGQSGQGAQGYANPNLMTSYYPVTGGGGPQTFGGPYAPASAGGMMGFV